MASDDDEKTRVGGLPPPMPKLPPKPPTAAPPAAEPSPAPPPAAAPAADKTHPGPVAPPPPPRLQASPPIESDEETVIVPRKRIRFTLQRVAPAGHSEIINLDRTNYLVGREPICDIRLYSPTSSREHARLTLSGDNWQIEPLPDKVVIADGVRIGGPTSIRHKMRLQLGDDELVFFDETAPASTAPSAPDSGSRLWFALLALVGVAIGAALVWFLTTS